MCPLEPPRIFPLNDGDDLRSVLLELGFEPDADVARHPQRRDQDQLVAVGADANAQRLSLAQDERGAISLGVDRKRCGGRGHHAVPPLRAPWMKSEQNPSARALATSRLIRFAVVSAKSRRCDGVSKWGDIAANEIRRLVSASSVSPTRSAIILGVVLSVQIEASAIAVRISAISLRLKSSSYSRVARA